MRGERSAVIDLSGDKLLPIGNSSFDSVAARSVFIDKSLLIADLLKSGYMATLFCRPRRFGKSLNMSMLKSFFEIPYEGASRKSVFENLAIWDAEGGRYRSEMGAYPVIHLSFRAAKSNSWAQAYGTLCDAIAREYVRHDYLAESSRLGSIERGYFVRVAERRGDAVDMADSLLRLEDMLAKHHSANVVLLIDEYDAPVMAGYSNGYYEDVVGFLRGLLTGALKDSDSLRLACLTGVQRISKESVFSDLNNLSVDTALSCGFDERFGFTQDEVRQLAEYLDSADSLDEAREWYDGYRFGESDIYNPWSILNYMQRGCAPDVYWANTSGNEVIGQMVYSAGDEVLSSLYSLLGEGGTVEVPLDLSVVFPEAAVGGTAIWSMLYLAGYLTTSDVDQPNNAKLKRRLRVPNKEISQLFRGEIVDRFEAVAGGADALDKLYACYVSADGAGVQRELQRVLLASPSHFDLVSENSYHMLMLGLCFGMAGYKTPCSNRESGHGRYDIQLVPDGSRAGLPLITIELKVALGADENVLNDLSLKALQQINERAYDTAAGEVPAVRLGIACCGKRVSVSAEKTAW